MPDPTLIFLFLAAIPIGVFGIVVGGNATLSVPTFQILFPEMTLGAIIGNIKPGSVLRNLTSLAPLWQSIDFATIKSSLLPLILGSTVGALFIAELSQELILPVLVLGFLVVEYSSTIARYVRKRVHFVMTFLTGMYGGVFGAGISLLIVALLKINNNDDSTLYQTRANALFLELFFTAAAVAVFVSFGLLIPEIVATWILGSICGGYLGGIVLKKTGTLSGQTQLYILRSAFIFAICVALIKIVA